MGFEFGKVNVNSKKKFFEKEIIENIVLIDKENPNSNEPFFIVLLDEFYDKFKLKSIEVFLKNCGLYNYKAICSLNIKISKKELKGDLINLYKNEYSNWRSYITPSTKAVIAVGASIYSILKSDDIITAHCLETVFQKSYFYCPSIKKYVFPIDSFYEIFHYDSQGENFLTGYIPFSTFKTRFAQYQIKKAISTSLLSPRAPNLILNKIETVEQMRELFNKIKDNEYVAYDLETSGFDFIKDKIICLTLSFEDYIGYYIPWNIIEKDKESLNNLLKRVKQIGANLKFDCKFLRYRGITNAMPNEDIVQLGHCINENRYNSLKTLAYFYTPYGGYDEELENYKEKTKIKDYSLIPENILFTYAVKDAIITRLVWKELQKELDYIDSKFKNEKDPENTLRYYYEQIMMPSVATFVDIEMKGMYVDIDNLIKNREYLLQEKKEMEKQMAKIFGVSEDFKFSSSTELSKLFEKLGWPLIERNETGGYSTSDQCLSKWALMNLPGAKELQRYRSLNVILKTFISENEESDSGWNKHIRYHPEDNSYRIHSTMNIMRTDTGRNRSCLVKNTKILIFNIEEDLIEEKNIEDVKKGDKILCLNEENRLTLDEVVWAGKTGFRNTLKIYYGRNNFLQCTYDHKIRMGNEYVEAKDLDINMELFYFDNDRLQKIKYKDIIIDNKEEKYEVYDIETKKYHNFFANNICVHNSDPNLQNIPAHGEFSSYVKKCISTPNKDEYYLCTADFSSLQVRLVAIDTNLNEDGPDVNLYKVYTDKNYSSDLHSVTAYNIFVAGKLWDMEIIEIELEDGTKKTFYADEWVKLKNGDTKKAKQLTENDELL